MVAEKRRPTPALPDHIERVYLIGICGAGMGSLAGMLVERGYEVLGSDRNSYPPMSDYLEARGIDILPGWDPANIDRLDDAPDLVVVGNVCRRDNPEVAAARARGCVCLSFPEVLRVVFLEESTDRLVISGTHGKTTTSAMLAWMLERALLMPSFMIGGVTGNFGSNFKLDAGGLFVIEGDEYDSAFFDKVPKFWHYEATTLAINNIEFDHADIYRDVEEIIGVFTRLVEQMPSEGCIYANLDDPNVQRVVAEAPCRVVGVGLEPQCDWRAEQLEVVEGKGMRFNVTVNGEVKGVIDSPMPGMHNVRNALMAAAVAHHHGVEFDELGPAMATFSSVKKRQELIGVARGVTIYDDFAHHPTAVRETVASIRARHPRARLWGLFEAKSNTSRRAIFQDAYPPALSGCDVVVLSSPWRKDTLAPHELIDLNVVAREIEQSGTQAHLIPQVEEIIEFVVPQLESGDVVLGMSGSAFDGLHHRLLQALQAL